MFRMTFETPLGEMRAVEKEGKLIALHFSEANSPLWIQKLPEVSTSLLKQVEAESLCFLRGEIRVFSIPWMWQGTPFQRQVWEALLKIPYGATHSYAEIARQIQRPRASRAVGQAVGANPLLLVVPCHRVIASDGSWGGFSGGAHRKQQLLMQEGYATLFRR